MSCRGGDTAIRRTDSSPGNSRVSSDFFQLLTQSAGIVPIPRSKDGRASAVDGEFRAQSNIPFKPALTGFAYQKRSDPGEQSNRSQKRN
jgi:hypothetical protein